MSRRGVNTVLDAAVFLVLVTAAVLALTGSVTPVEGPPPAAPAAEVVATSTAELAYSLAPGARRADERLVEFPVKSSPEFRRYAHGTHASLLAEAAVGNVSIAGSALTHTYDGFERAIENATENATGRRVAVRASWAPYRGAPVGGRVRAGPRPPGRADVSAVTLTVDSGMPAVRDRVLAAARKGGYDGAARTLARATVRGLVPPNKTRFALEGDYPVDRLVEYRYRRAGQLLSANVGPALADGDTRGANRQLSRALADLLERHMRSSFATPEAAARAVRLAEVRIVVRRWSS